MSENKIKLELNDALAKFLDSGADSLKWLVQMEQKYNKNFLADHTIFDKFWNTFITTSPNDMEITQYLLSKTESESKDLLLEKFSSLIESGTEAQYGVFIDLMANRESEISDEVRAKLREAFEKKVNSIDFPNNVKLYEAIIKSRPGSDNDELKAISEKIQPWTTENIPEKQTAAFKLLKLINEKADVFTDPIGASFCLEAASDFLSKGDAQGFHFIDFLIDFNQKLTYRQREKLAELLESQLTKDIPKNITMNALNRIEKLINLKETSLLKIVLKFAEIVSDDELKNKCKAILINSERDLFWNQKDKAKKIFGDEVFGTK